MTFKFLLDPDAITVGDLEDTETTITGTLTLMARCMTTLDGQPIDPVEGRKLLRALSLADFGDVKKDFLSALKSVVETLTT